MAWLRRLNFEFRQAALHTVGNQVRIWILKRPDMPEASHAIRSLPPPRDFSFGRDILVRIGLAEHGFQCDTFCYYDSAGGKQTQRVAHDVTCRDFDENYPVPVIQAAAVNAIHNAVADLEKNYLSKHSSKSNARIKVLSREQMNR